MDANGLIKSSIGRSLHTTSTEKITHLSLVYSQKCLAWLNKERSHLHRLRRWIDDQLKSLNVTSLRDLDNEKISDRVESLVHGLAETPAASAANALQNVCSNIGAGVSGHGSLLEDMLASKTIAELYEIRNGFDISLFIQKLAHCKPNLQTLEIGFRKSSQSEIVQENWHCRMCGFSVHSIQSRPKGSFRHRNQTKKIANIEYASLDVNEDPLEQGFEANHYDLVIARNAIYAIRSIGQSLRNIKRLLHPDGRLLLQELRPTLKRINYILGIHPWCWCGLEDGRLDEPYLDLRAWQNELFAAGYEDGDAVIIDSAEPSQLNVLVVVKPPINHNLSKRLNLLCRDATTDPGLILQELKNKGYEVFRCTMLDPPLPGQNVIALLDKDGLFFENIDTTSFSLFKNFLHKLDNSGVFGVTQLSQIYCLGPRFGQTIGVARATRSEMLIDLASCEVDSIDLSAAQIIQVFTKFQKQNTTDDILKADFEYSIYEGVIKVGRF